MCSNQSVIHFDHKAKLWSKAKSWTKSVWTDNHIGEEQQCFVHELKVNSVVIVSSYNLWKTSILTLLRELNNWLGNANQQLIYVFIYKHIQNCG